ncbi:MAG: signal peptidase I [Actinobacteria bacterium]|uniref:signal peptidase I n=1 Tax=freshwater metagenome TaxID=449393 RepID=A0A6J5ZSJ6_9ZZZZ|nr:signal peptidase I [Actinomycetota bacterium]
MGKRIAHRRKKPSLLREIVTVVGSALILSVLVRTFLIQAFYVPSESMMNTLLDNDRIIVSKIATKITGVDRGNVVVFHDPGKWLGDSYDNPYDTPVGRVLQFVGIVPANSGSDLVKRVIAVADDTVACCDAQGRIQLNGKGIDEPYIKDGEQTDQISFQVLVPEGYVFVMGDNRGNSEDSRFHLDLNNGLVPLKEIVGRVSVRVWPLNRIGGIER